MSDNNPTHIDSNIDMDIEAKFNADKDMTGGNLHKKNSEIHIENLFQQV